MTTKFTVESGRIHIVSLVEDGKPPLKLTLNLEAAIEWRDGIAGAILELDQARFRAAGEKATKRRRAKKAP